MTCPNPSFVGHPQDRSSSKKELFILAGIFSLAFLVRLLYLYSYSHSDYWDALIMDPGTHWELAHRIAEGKGLGPYAYFRAPFYFYLLAGFLRLFGESLWPIRFFQALAGSLTAALAYHLARQLLPRPAALLAGLFQALFWLNVYYDAELLTENPATLLSLVGLVLLFHADQRITAPLPLWRRFLWPLAAGIFLGLAAITRPNVMLFNALVVLVLLAEAMAGAWKKERQRAWRLLAAAGLFAAGVGGCVAPVTIRNWVVAHDFVLIASQGGINFWIGNHASADGRTVVVPYTRREIPLSFIESRRDHPWVREDVWLSSAYGAELALGRRARESEISAYWYSQALAWIRAQPERAALLFLKKCLYLFQAVEVSNNRDLNYHRRSFLILQLLSVLHFGMLSPLLLAGLVFAFFQWRRWRWVVLFLAAYGASVVAYFVTSRYRIPFLPAGMCLVGLALTELWRAGKGVGAHDLRERCRAILPKAGLIVLLAGVVNMPWPAWNDRPLRSAMHYNLGIALAQKERWEGAERELRAALAVKSFYPEAHFWLGRVYGEAGRWEEAVAEFRAVVEQAPAYAPGHYELARALLHLAGAEGGEGERYRNEAFFHFSRAHELAPKLYPAPPRQ